MNTYKQVIKHGSSILFKLTVVDVTTYHNYSYNLRYKMGYANRTALINYPYPIPLVDGKELKLFPFINNNDTIFYGNKFALNSGDTVLCMRKGIVTNVLSKNENQDRILESSTIEVLHEDGTVAFYSIPAEDHILVNPGQNVYPLQPLLVLKSAGTLTVGMFDINGVSPKTFDFILEPAEEKEGNPKIKLVTHSPGVRERELTNKELKRLAKGNLY